MVFDAILVGSGILWTLAYLLIIRQGFLDRTYGMPLVALCANISWEFIFAFVYPTTSRSAPSTSCGSRSTP